MKPGRTIRRTLAWALVLTLAACGGGTPGDGTDAPSTASAALVVDQPTAQALVDTARAGTAALWPGGTVAGSTVVGQPSVTVVGNEVVIESGTLHSDFAGGWLALDYSGWTYDSRTGVASAGTITISGITGNSAAITIGPGGYSVAITVFGLTVRFDVPFA